MAKRMKKNSSVHKVSQRAIEMREEREQQERELAEQNRKKAKKKQDIKDAALTSLGGFLTLMSLLIGVYGLISIPAIVLCWMGLQKNKDYGWRGMLIPVICIVLNVAWILFQIAIIIFPDFRLFIYNLFYA